MNYYIWNINYVHSLCLFCTFLIDLNLNVDLIFVYIEITFKCIFLAIDLAWLVKVVLLCQGEIQLGCIVHQLRVTEMEKFVIYVGW